MDIQIQDANFENLDYSNSMELTGNFSLDEIRRKFGEGKVSSAGTVRWNLTVVFNAGFLRERRFNIQLAHMTDSEFPDNDVVWIDFDVIASRRKRKKIRNFFAGVLHDARYR